MIDEIRTKHFFLMDEDEEEDGEPEDIDEGMDDEEDADDKAVDPFAPEEGETI